MWRWCGQWNYESGLDSKQQRFGFLAVESDIPVQLAPQIHQQDGAGKCIFYGRLDDGAKKDEIPAQAALRLYLEKGVYGLAVLVGDFSGAIFDQQKNQLVLFRDAMGMRPLYYLKADRQVVFGNHIGWMNQNLNRRPSADLVGMASVYLRRDFPMTGLGRTCFQGVNQVVSAHAVIFTGLAEPKYVRYWDFNLKQKIRLKDEREYEEELKRLFLQAVGRRIRGKTVVSVSGGVDSSSIFCSARSLNPSVEGLTYQGKPGSPADELKFLDTLDRIHPGSIERMQFEDYYGFWAGIEDQVRATEMPLVASMNRLLQGVQQRAKAKGAETILTGHWGDQVMTSSASLHDLFAQLRWFEYFEHAKVCSKFNPRVKPWPFFWMCFLGIGWAHTPETMKRVIRRFRRKRQLHDDLLFSHALRFAKPGVREDDPQYPRKYATYHSESLYFEVRRKFTAQCHEWNWKYYASQGLAIAHPVLDRDLVEWAMAIPGEVLNVDGVPRGLLRRAMKGLVPDLVLGRWGKGDFTEGSNQGLFSDALTVFERTQDFDLPRQMGWIERDLDAIAAMKREARTISSHSELNWKLGYLCGLDWWGKINV